jgi:hypothetical protein
MRLWSGSPLRLARRPGFTGGRALDIPAFLPYPIRTLGIPPFDRRPVSPWLFSLLPWLGSDLAPYQSRLLLARIIRAPVVITSIR